MVGPRVVDVDEAMILIKGSMPSIAHAVEESIGVYSAAVCPIADPSRCILPKWSSFSGLSCASLSA